MLRIVVGIVLIFPAMEMIADPDRSIISGLALGLIALLIAIWGVLASNSSGRRLQ